MAPMRNADLRPPSRGGGTTALLTWVFVAGCQSISGLSEVEVNKQTASPDLDASVDGPDATGAEASGHGGATASGGSSDHGGLAGDGGPAGQGGAAEFGGSSGQGGVAGDGGAAGQGGLGGSGGASGQTGDGGSSGQGGTSGSCQGVSCDAPPASYCTDASHVAVYKNPGICSNGICSYPSHQDYCNFGCSLGACEPDPCLGVVCQAPPDDYCASADTLRAHDTVGSCSAGTCSYATHDIFCPHGCANGICRCQSDTDCAFGEWCNEPACTPCVSDQHCGYKCLPCAGSTPQCNGAQCECTSTSCEPYNACVSGACQHCNSDDACGPSCTPCPGVTRHCIDEGATSSCQECTDNSQCSSQVCQSDHTCGNGFVAPGTYVYTPISTSVLINPVDVAWHPSGEYALVLNSADTVFRYDRASQSLSKVASEGPTIEWKRVRFKPDGSVAAVLGNDAGSKEGRIYKWTSAGSGDQLSELPGERLAGGSYESVEWSPDGTTCRVLGRNASSSNNIAYLWKLDLATGRSDAKATNTSAGCQDVAWATDQSDAAAIAVVCGVNGAQLLHLDSNGVFVGHTGNSGNTSTIAGRPQGDYALAICRSCNGRLFRFQKGVWQAEYSAPQAVGALAIGFSTDGARALMLGGATSVGYVGQVYEYRHDLYAQNEITTVSIPDFYSAPYDADPYVNLNAVAWRPGCDEGLIVGGSNTYSSKKGYLIGFQVTNGTSCP